MQINLTTLQPRHRQIEIVERKGIGHPDTVCDALAEALSVALSRHYLDRFGMILHHNVDKVLLRAGVSRPAFGGGKVVEPFEVYFAGRASDRYQGIAVPIDELVTETARDWLAAHFHALDAERHVRVHNLLHPGSADLVELFQRQQASGVALANDTSCGVGYAPLSPLEGLVLEVERSLNGPAFKARFPAAGEDIKLMGLSAAGQVQLTVACAFVDCHVPDLDAYRALREALLDEVRDLAAARGMAPVLSLNTGDDLDSGSVYLTVTGTSAESGDDGEVGRGNRVNGLIAPLRPMNMEAAAGKNPVTHVGKLYNIAATRLAAAIHATVESVEAVECYLVSRIGSPVNRPQLVDIALRCSDDAPVESVRAVVEPIVVAHLDGIDSLWREVITGRVAIY